MGWSGVKNGNLLNLCVSSGFDLLLTIDKNMQYQQSLDKYPITVVVLDSLSSKLEELIQFIPSFMALVNSFEENNVYLLKK